MYIIDQTYFIKELNIPNLNEMDSDTLSTLNIDIDKYVRLVLQNALGCELFKELDSYIIDGTLDINAPNKWQILVNGAEYTYNDKTYNWKGLIFTEGTFKGSLLAKYVYYHWLSDSISLLTGTGEKSITATNAELVNSGRRLVTVWNDFVSDYQSMHCYNNTYNWHRNVGFLHYNNQSRFVSLVQFLTHFESDFPKTTKMLYNTQNQLGI